MQQVGYEPRGLLETAGIQPNGEHAMEPIEDAVQAVMNDLARSQYAKRHRPLF